MAGWGGFNISGLSDLQNLTEKFKETIQSHLEGLPEESPQTNGISAPERATDAFGPTGGLSDGSAESKARLGPATTGA